MFPYPRACPNSVLKFVTDIFSSRDTSDFFYTADMKILIEIVLRQLADLSPGAGVRQQIIPLHVHIIVLTYRKHL